MNSSYRYFYFSEWVRVQTQDFDFALTIKWIDNGNSRYVIPCNYCNKIKNDIPCIKTAQIRVSQRTNY